MQVVIRQAPLNLSERALTPEQTLAGAVFSQALIDARNVHVSERCRTSATAFLLEAGAMFTFWASVAGLEAELVREQAQQCLTTSPAPVAVHPRRNGLRRLLTRAPQHERTGNPDAMAASF
jgi:hypothetical protein